MSNRIFLTIVLVYSFLVSYAQCDDLLQSAQRYKNQGEYGNAVKYYNDLEKQCPNYFTETIRGERNYCKKMEESQNRSKPKNTSSGYIPAQRFSSDSAHNTRLYFDAEGASRHSSRVTLDMTVTDVDNKTEWFSVEIEYGNTVVVHCEPNPYSSVRKDSFLLLLNNGESVATIYVEQEGKGSSPRPKTRTNYTTRTDSPEETKEEQPIIVKITFEKGKSKPKFDNNIGPLITAMGENKNLDLQIEVYKCESQSGLKNFIKAPLIDKRFKEIMEYFGSFEIATDRISKNIIVIDGDKSGAECDCAYAKTKRKE